MERRARLAYLSAGKIDYDANVRKEYDNEVKSLRRKLADAKMNAPLERQAQLAAATVVKGALADNPCLPKDEQKKLGQRALKAARLRLGAHRKTVEITDREWEAIQRGAVHDSFFAELYQHSNKEDIRIRSTPRTYKPLSSAQKAKIRSMKNSGKTTAQIADALGVSVSTVVNIISGKEE